ncbi:MAG: hypothetical protein FWF97_04875 [Alphaproteobacteria bacterium]|nr:hypothetical protein [Alphaproteobacteria bacterium]
MRKTLSLAAMAAAFAAPAMAANLENPLYMPKSGEVYSKTSLGLMYKKTNDNLAMQAKERVGASEFPIIRANEDIGVGLADWLTLRGSFGYTHDGDIDRSGMHNGRLGLNFRAFDGMITDGWVWDIYFDAQLGGISKMKAELVQSPDMLGGAYPLSFNYDNYSNGRWGAWLGTQVGKTWGDFTAAAFAEVLHTFGNNNNNIRIGDGVSTVVAGMLMANPAVDNAWIPPYIAGLPDSFSVYTKSTWEYNFGLKTFYEIDSQWSLGGAFTYKHRAENSITAVDLKNSSATPTHAVVAGITAGIADSFVGPMKDGIDEYILTAVVARKLTDSVQVAVYGEYTFDDAQPKSQNGTDIKAELGVRVNVAF